MKLGWCVWLTTRVVRSLCHSSTQGGDAITVMGTRALLRGPSQTQDDGCSGPVAPNGALPVEGDRSGIASTSPGITESHCQPVPRDREAQPGPPPRPSSSCACPRPGFQRPLFTQLRVLGCEPLAQLLARPTARVCLCASFFVSVARSNTGLLTVIIYKATCKAFLK